MCQRYDARILWETQPEGAGQMGWRERHRFRAWAGTLVLAASVVAGLGRPESDPNSRIDVLRGVYDAERAKLADAFQARRQTVIKRYGEGLAALEKRFRRVGELESILAIQAERKRFAEAAAVPSTPGPDFPPVALNLQRDCRSVIKGASLEESKGVILLTDRYASHLTGLMKQLTIERKIEEALAVKQELEDVKAGEAYQAARFAVADHESSTGRNAPAEAPVRARSQTRPAAGGFAVAWRPRSGNAATVANGARTRTAPLRHEGRNQILPSNVLCQGGRTFVDGVDADLLAACRKSNALTIGITLATRSLDQAGPARILSCSLDGHHRNFSLCQEGELFVLRLRTMDTGPNGTSPEVRLCRVRPREDITLIIAYRPGELRLYCDGRETPVQQITGDLSNWEEYPLLLGNEWQADRQWSGRILRFFVAGRFLGKVEATRMLGR